MTARYTFAFLRENVVMMRIKSSCRWLVIPVLSGGEYVFYVQPTFSPSITMRSVLATEVCFKIHKVRLRCAAVRIENERVRAQAKSETRENVLSL